LKPPPSFALDAADLRLEGTMATELLPEVMRGDHETGVADDVECVRTGIVNCYLVGDPGAGGWTLVDAGLFGFAHTIADAAARRFGADARPSCIVLTHGHFDHVGALHTLAERWNVPIYAHEDELPYLTGAEAYPPPDPTVGGGLMALTSPLFPNGPFDFRPWIRALPPDGSVPELSGWRWLPTPGHARGHVSLWRAADRTLIAGDAFITTNQESAYAVARQEPELHGPPMYYTPDWTRARDSVRYLASLDPEVAVTGHGRALHGEEMRQALHRLADNFDEIAVPEHGRYVEH
jgi:glyoxylase-like metal-dependent hydrolase (beta-lactamase superfamily II)